MFSLSILFHASIFCFLRKEVLLAPKTTWGAAKREEYCCHRNYFRETTSAKLLFNLNFFFIFPVVGTVTTPAPILLLYVEDFLPSGNYWENPPPRTASVTFASWKGWCSTAQPSFTTHRTVSMTCSGGSGIIPRRVTRLNLDSPLWTSE